MSLREFVKSVDGRGELVRVEKAADPVYEASAVITALKGKTVLFERVKGHDMPVVSNVCSTRKLVATALGVEPHEVIGRIARAIAKPEPPATASADTYREIEPDLGRLPVLTHYAEDAGPYIASGIAVACDPDHGINASYHRALVRGPTEIVLRVVERHFHAYIERGLRDFAFCIGSPIPVLLGAAISVDIGTSEIAIANALADTRVVEIDGHQVPESELVMICRLTGEIADEGPFLDLTGTFDVVRKQPVAQVLRVFARPDPLFHALVPGDLEHKLLMGMPREPTMFAEVSKVCECLDVRVTPGGCSWLHGAVKIRKRDDDDGKRAIEAAFRGHPSMKHVFVVDEDIDIDDPAQIEWAMATRFQGDRDMVVKTGEKGSSLDPSSDLWTKETTKVGFDLTVPGTEAAPEFRRGELPVRVKLEDYL
jgi:UbiD family decarboxylase